MPKQPYTHKCNPIRREREPWWNCGMKKQKKKKNTKKKTIGRNIA
jgi:hypothetical protein